MIDKNERRKVISRQAIDPAVAQLIHGQDKRQAEMQLPARERQRKAKQRRKDQERLARRVNWEIPISLKVQINKIAESESIPTSQVVALLILLGIQDIAAGRIRVFDFKEPNPNSPRYRFQLSLPLGNDDKPRQGASLRNREIYTRGVPEK